MRERRSHGVARLGALAGLLASVAGGCSFVFAEGPPPPREWARAFECTESYAAPVTDTVLATVGGVLTVFLVGLSHALGGSHPERIALFGVATVGLPAGSAVYGYAKVGSCRDAQREWAAARRNAR